MWRRYGESLNFLSLCETRWNSVQACFASLLRVRSALKLFWCEWNEDKEYPVALQVLGKDRFWRELEQAEEVICPLSTASDMLPRDENTVADVVACFGEIYDGFANNTVYGPQLVSILEKRWEVCEQPLFMLGYFLHPGYGLEAFTLPETSLTALGNVAAVAMYYFRRYVSSEVGGLRKDLMSWFAGRFTSADANEYKVAPLEYWADVRLEKPKSKLPVLAATVLSIAVNTATCERLFSELALIHTATRNRMHPSKVLDIQVVRKRSREDDRASDVVLEQLRIVDPVERDIKDVTDTLDALSNSVSRRDSDHCVDIEGDSDGEDCDEHDEPVIDDDFGNDYIGEILDEDMEEEIANDSDHQASDDDNYRLESRVEVDSARDSVVNEVEQLDPLEAIRVPTRPAFPTTKQKFSQESKLTGIRSTKVTLKALFDLRRQQRLEEKRRRQAMGTR